MRNIYKTDIFFSHYTMTMFRTLEFFLIFLSFNLCKCAFWFQVVNTVDNAYYAQITAAIIGAFG